MAIKTTKEIFNQEVVFKGNLRVIGNVLDESGREKYISKYNIPSLYNHRIMLAVPAGRSFVFDAVTTDNTPINTITDLCTKLGNTEYSGCGYIDNNRLSNVIHIGTDSATTYFLSATSASMPVTLDSSDLTTISDRVTAISVSPHANAKEAPVWDEEEEETPSEPTPKKSKAKSK